MNRFSQVTIPFHCIHAKIKMGILKNTLCFYKYLGWLFPVMDLFFSRYICTLRELGLAMIHAATKGYNEQIPEVETLSHWQKIVKKPAISRVLHSLNN